MKGYYKCSNWIWTSWWERDDVEEDIRDDASNDENMKMFDLDDEDDV